MHRANWKSMALALGILMAAALAAWWYGNRRQPAPQLGSSPATTTPNPANVARSSVSGLAEALRGAQSGIEAAQDAQSRRKQLAALQQAFSTSSTNEAVTAIRHFLDSRADASTGLGFKLAGHGLLSEAPTL